MKMGRVMIKGGWVGGRWAYQEVLVEQAEDGSLLYYHGGPTCKTADGMVSLPEEYRDKIVWDKQATEAK